MILLGSGDFEEVTRLTSITNEFLINNTNIYGNICF